MIWWIVAVTYSDIYMFADDAKFFRHIVQPHLGHHIGKGI